MVKGKYEVLCPVIAGAQRMIVGISIPQAYIIDKIRQGEREQRREYGVPLQPGAPSPCPFLPEYREPYVPEMGVVEIDTNNVIPTYCLSTSLEERVF